MGRPMIYNALALLLLTVIIAIGYHYTTTIGVTP